MIDKSKKILITSALPYVNNVPHLGNLIGCVLSADVFARFSRASGHKTLFVCGSDEHGTATENKAKEEGVTPQQLCDKYYTIHKDIYDWFDISFDIFGRTSEENHHQQAQKLFTEVVKNGFIEEKTVTQPFCTTCNAFLADRFIEGTCPYCQSEGARGDQCDSCGKLLTPKELINPHCKADKSTPEFRDTDHLFLSLDTLQPVLEAWVKQQSQDGHWTQNAVRITNAWFKEGLKARAITRDLKWGIPIPKSAFEGRYKDKVFYVWFDAPIGYISITQQLLGDDYKQWWLDPQNTHLYQFMGKDNIPFHSIIFPATLLAASNSVTPETITECSYTLVHHLNVTEYLNYEHTKFSKSNNVGVFGDNAQESGIPADVFRYVLMYYRPENADTQFTWKGLQERLNNELVANFGNLVNRTLSFTNRFLDSKIQPLTHGDLDVKQKEFYDAYVEKLKEYERLLSDVKLRDALSQFMKISSLANQFFQEREPWASKNSNKNQCEKDISLLAHLVKDLAICIAPYMPETSKNIFSMLNTKERDFSDLTKLSLESVTIEPARVLFKKLDDKAVEFLKEKYGGSQKKSLKESSKEKPEKSKNNTTADNNNNNNNNGEDQKKSSSLVSSDIDLRVGKIIDIKKHPKADKLYIEQVDLGDKTIQIVSGLVPHYKPEELLGKKIIVVANLKPVKLRGEKSTGMLLAADTLVNGEETVGVIFAPDASLGSRLLAGMDAPAKEEITFEEFMTLRFSVEEGQVYLNDGVLIAQNSDLIVDKNITNARVR